MGKLAGTHIKDICFKTDGCLVGGLEPWNFIFFHSVGKKTHPNCQTHSMIFRARSTTINGLVFLGKFSPESPMIFMVDFFFENRMGFRLTFSQENQSIDTSCRWSVQSIGNGLEVFQVPLESLAWERLVSRCQRMDLGAMAPGAPGGQPWHWLYGNPMKPPYTMDGISWFIKPIKTMLEIYHNPSGWWFQT